MRTYFRVFVRIFPRCGGAIKDGSRIEEEVVRRGVYVKNIVIL